MESLNSFIMKRFIFIVIILIPSFIIAQNNPLTLLPIKEKGKWGLLDAATGAVTVEPVYDRIGKRTPWGIYIIQDDKVGLVDLQGNIICEPQYNDIKRLNRDYYKVTLLDGTLNVIDRKNKELQLPINHYTKIESNKNDYFFATLENEKWGIIKNKIKVLPFEYNALYQSNAKNIIYFISEENKGVVNLETGQQTIINDYDSICPQNDVYSSVTLNNKWGLVNHQTKEVIFKPKYSKIKFLSNYYLELVEGYNTSHLFSLEKNKIVKLQHDFSRFEYFNDEYFKAYQEDKVGLINKEGEVAIPPVYDQVVLLKKGDKNYYKVYNNGVQGIFDIKNKKEVVVCIYSNIQYLKEDQMYKIHTLKGFGLVNKNFKTIIPEEYQSIVVAGNTIKCQKNKSTIIFHIDDEQNVISVNEFAEVFKIRIGYNTSSLIKSNQTLNVSRTVDFPNVNYAWIYDPDKKGNAFKHINRDTVESNYIYRPVEVKNTHFSIVQTPEDKNRPEILDVITQRYWRINPFLLFDGNQGKFLSDSTYFIGFRFSDFLYRGMGNMVAILANGDFVLLDINGNFVKNKNGETFKASFIDKSKNGYRRFAVGGTWTDKHEKKWQKIGRTKDIVKDFNFEYLENQSWRVITSLYLEGAKWGVLDSLGNIVIEPTYDFLENMKNEKIVSYKNDKGGIIDINENIILPHQYSRINYQKQNNNYLLIHKNDNLSGYVMDAGGGMILKNKYQFVGEVKDNKRKVAQKNKYGFIDENENVVIPFQYDQLTDFNEGYALATNDSTSIIIDKNGKEYFKNSEFKVLGNINNGLIRAKKNDQYGFVDIQGNIKIPFMYKLAFDFNENFARVVVGRKTGLIDSQNNFMLLPTKYELIFPFDTNGLAIVQNKEFGPMGLINKKGEEILAPTYDHIDPFCNGYAKVKKNKRFGLINLSGQEIIPVKMYNIFKMYEGKIAVQEYRGGKWKFLDESGTPVFDTLYFNGPAIFKNDVAILPQKDEEDRNINTLINVQGEKLFSSSGNIALVSYSDSILIFRKRTFIDETNYTDAYYFKKINEVNYRGSEKGYAYISPFKNGVAICKKDGYTQLIDTNGNTVITPKYNSIKKNKDGSYYAAPSTFYGLASAEGEVLLEPTNDLFKPATFSNFGIYTIEQGDKLGYADGNGNWIWKLQN